MSNNSLETQKPQVNRLFAVATVIIIILAAIIGVALTIFYPNIGSLLSGSAYVSGGLFYDAIYVMLTLATDVLYLFGAGILLFGGMIIVIHFLKTKLKDAFTPSHSTHYLSGYLTLSLNFFIGAEIIRTVAVRTYEEFALLILVIISRGLFSLILYLERKWVGTAETE
jgi:uncharacterized membrane protein